MTQKINMIIRQSNLLYAYNLQLIELIQIQDHL